MRHLHVLRWEPLRWFRNSAVFTLLLLGICAVLVGLDSADVKALSDVTLAVMALVVALIFINLDFKGKPLDEALCKLSPIVLGAIFACSIFFYVVGGDRQPLISIALTATSILGVAFGIQMTVANVWPLLKGQIWNKG